jgi:hypothetical protein
MLPKPRCSPPGRIEAMAAYGTFWLQACLAGRRGATDWVFVVWNCPPDQGAYCRAKAFERFVLALTKVITILDVSVSSSSSFSAP